MAGRFLMGCCTLYMVSTPLTAETLHFESPQERVRVVELFTSQGCSSCPPADAWLRRFVQDPGLWRQVVPLAFHVDYWDYLGWQDRFAAKAYSRRQRDYRQSGGLGSVYTPGVLVNGHEWRGWYRGQPLPATDAVPPGRLKLEVEPERFAIIRLSQTSPLARKGLRAHLAVLGSGLTSRIGGGENSGRELAEAFVVLGQSTAAARGADGTWRLAWPALKARDADRLAVAAWLSRGDNPTPLQAVGGWLP
jgi:hypothetical protein